MKLDTLDDKLSFLLNEAHAYKTYKNGAYDLSYESQEQKETIQEILSDIDVFKAVSSGKTIGNTTDTVSKEWLAYFYPYTKKWTKEDAFVYLDNCKVDRVKKDGLYTVGAYTNQQKNLLGVILANVDVAREIKRGKIARGSKYPISKEWLSYFHPFKKPWTEQEKIDYLDIAEVYKAKDDEGLNHLQINTVEQKEVLDDILSDIKLESKIMSGRAIPKSGYPISKEWGFFFKPATKEWNVNDKLEYLYHSQVGLKNGELVFASKDQKENVTNILNDPEVYNAIINGQTPKDTYLDVYQQAWLPYFNKNLSNNTSKDKNTGR